MAYLDELYEKVSSRITGEAIIKASMKALIIEEGRQLNFCLGHGNVAMPSNQYVRLVRLYIEKKKRLGRLKRRASSSTFDDCFNWIELQPDDTIPGSLTYAKIRYNELKEEVAELRRLKSIVLFEEY